MKKFTKQINNNFAAFRAALASVYKPLYKMLYIKQLSQFFIFRAFFKSIKIIFLTATIGTGIWCFIFVIVRIGDFNINMDPSYLIAIASTAIVGYIENVYGAIRNTITKLHARHLHKLLSNPETIEKAEKVNRNIQKLGKEQVKDIYFEVGQIERLNQQKKDLEIASKLVPDNVKAFYIEVYRRRQEQL